MKKKLLIIISIFFIILTGCKNNNLSKATITTKELGEIEITSKEIVKIYNQDKEKFSKNYKGNYVEFTDKITKISQNKNSNIPEFYEIYFQGGWVVKILKEDSKNNSYTSLKTYDVSKLTKNMKVKVKSKLENVSYDDVILQNISSLKSSQIGESLDDNLNILSYRSIFTENTKIEIVK